MKCIIILSVVFLGFGCASTKQSYCDIVDDANAPVVEDEQVKDK